MALKSSSYQAWHLRGCVSSKFIRVFREYNREHRLGLISLLEIRISGEKAKLVLSKLGFQNSHRVEVVAFFRGIWIVWRDSIKVKVLKSHSLFILTKVTDNSFKQPLLASFVYDSPNSHKRRNLWDSWKDFTPLDGSLWVAIGDFNAIISSSEKKGRVRGKRCLFFGSFMDSAHLHDLGFKGAQFT
ncbi:hypothetical protein V6Z11_D06G154900 [Gossypium hirsutum]